MRIGDFDNLKVHISELLLVYSGEELANAILNAIDNAPTVERQYFPPCEDCHKKMDDIRRAYDKAMARPQGKWVITLEDTKGIHHIKCPFCKFEKGSEFEPYIKVTFEKLPNFCEYCGADMRKQSEGLEDD